MSSTAWNEQELVLSTTWAPKKLSNQDDRGMELYEVIMAKKVAKNGAAADERAPAEIEGLLPTVEKVQVISATDELVPASVETTPVVSKAAVEVKATATAEATAVEKAAVISGF